MHGYRQMGCHGCPDRGQPFSCSPAPSLYWNGRCPTGGSRKILYRNESLYRTPSRVRWFIQSRLWTLGGGERQAKRRALGNGDRPGETMLYDRLNFWTKGEVG